MSRLSKKSKAEVSEFLLDKLEDIITDEKVGWKEKIKSIELAGREFGMFTERKQINVDIQSIVHQLTDRELKTLSQGSDRDTYIDVLPRLDVGESGASEGTGGATASADSGDQGSRSEDEHGVDQAVAPED